MALAVSDTITPHRGLYRLSWALIFYTIVIIAWGAWVRISGSGDGCGDHWPLCNGQAIPIGHTTKTWIEVSHRYSTALFGLFVLAQIVFIRRALPARHPARSWVLYTLLFTLTEALIGRQLVTSGLVNESQSLHRLVIMPLHLVNTSLLLFSEVMTAESIVYGSRRKITLSETTRRWCIGVSAALLLLLTTGAIAALASHLFPSQSLLGGLSRDFESSSHMALRLRIIHPILGLLLPAAIWTLVVHTSHRAATPSLARMYRAFGVAIFLMTVLGIVTLVTLAPPWLKLTHLTMANVLVILFSRCLFHSLRPE